MLSFGELVALASTVQPEGELAARLQSLLNTPFIQSELSSRIFIRAVRM
jgi:hypothetical protein